jgi:hypothetical protein
MQKMDEEQAERETGRALIVRCTRHPDVETALRCSRCDTPICPRCLVSTPVGARCRECARISKSPIYTLSRGYLVRAILAAGIAGAVMGIVWGYFTRDVGGAGGFFSFFVGAGLGYAFTQIMERAVNRKRGPTVAGLAMAGLGLAWAIQFVMVGNVLLVGNLIALGVGLYMVYHGLVRV